MLYLLDTNVLIRLITQDDEVLFKKARDIFQSSQEEGYKLLITPIVIAEVLYVLTSKNLYNIDKDKSVLAVKIILETKNVLVEEKTVILESLDLFAEKNLDYADCYLLAKKTSGKCDGVLTFDNRLAKFLEV